ncbi:hypothetical protein ACFLQ1_01900 [Candidatus Auribacterota bacterium]
MDKQINKNDRGVALVLVLGVMAVMVGIALTFASSMRLTEKASQNYYYSWQALYAAKAGLHRAIFALRDDVHPGEGPPQSNDSGANDSVDSMSDHLNERWHWFFTGSDQYLEEKGNTGSRWIILTQPDTINLGPHIYSRYAVLVKDEAGKINFNVASNYSNIKQGISTFELSLKKPFENDGMTDAIADQIVSYRYGLDGDPGIDGIDDNKNNHAWGAANDGLDNNPGMLIDEIGEGRDEPYEYSPYDPLLSDDRPFQSIEEIKDPNKSGLDEAIFFNIVDDITVYSKGREQYMKETSIGSGNWEWHNKFCLNHIKSAASLYSLIAEREGALTPDEGHIQKALNIIDYVDEDPIPTSLSYTSGNISDTFYGIEGVRITEVMARPEIIYNSLVNDLFTPGEINDPTWTWVNASLLASAQDASTQQVNINIVRKGKYKVFIESFDDTNSAKDNTFILEIDNSFGTNNIGTGGNHGAGDWEWEYIGNADFDDPDPPSNNKLRLYRSVPPMSVADAQVRTILFTQQGGPPGNSIEHDCEYIELSNISRKPINVANWNMEIFYGDGSNTTFQIPELTSENTSNSYSTTVPSDGRLILVKDVANTGAYNDGGSDITIANDSNGDGINFENSWGNNNGIWGDDNSNTGSETYPVLKIPDLDIQDLDITQINLYAYQTAQNPTNNSGLTDPFVISLPVPLGDNRSAERIIPFFSDWQYSNDTKGSTPGRSYENDSFEITAPYSAANDSGKVNDWAIKDGPLANIGEILNIYTLSNTLETIDNDTLTDLADAVTTSYIKLEAEDVMSSPGVPATPGNYGTSWYQITGISTWEWTSEFADQGSDIVNLIPDANSGSYNLFLYGEPGQGVTATIPTENRIFIAGESPTTIASDLICLPNRSSYVGWIKTAPDVTSIPENPSIKFTLQDSAATSGNSYFDYAVLTPGIPMAGKININTVTKPKLLTALPGIDNMTQANDIFNNRPYQSHEAFINEIVSNTGSLYNTSFDITDYKLISNMITFSSDIYEIIARGQVYYDLNGDGIAEKILAEKTVKSVIDRSQYRRDDNRDGDPDGPIKTLYYRIANQ